MKKRWNYFAGLLLLVLVLAGSTACSASSDQANQYMQDVSLSAEHQWTGEAQAAEVTKAVTVTPTPAANNEEDSDGLSATPGADAATDENSTGSANQGDSPDDSIALSPTDSPDDGVTDLSSLTITPTPQATADPTVEPGQTGTATDATAGVTVTAAPTSTPSDTTGTNEDSSEPQVPSFSGTSYVVMDADTGKIMLSCEAKKQIYPASTIKLLTALTALDYLDMDETITAEQSLLDQVEWDATQYGVVAGTSYPLSVWMHLLLISSYGDAADVIANAAGGSLSDFVDKMNQKAKDLGLANTKVDNAIGLDIGNDYSEMYSTAEDIAKLARYAMRNNAICEIVAKAKYTVPACDAMASREIESTNWYLTKGDTYSSEYFTAIGTKSGSTDAAGSCYVATVVNDEGKKYICAYFGGASKDTVFREMTAFLEYTYKYLT